MAHARLTSGFPAPTQLAKAWMNAWTETLRSSNALQKFGQLLALVLRQNRTECFIVLLCDPANVMEHRLALIGEVEFIRAPIIEAILPLHKATLLQLVNDRH